MKHVLFCLLLLLVACQAEPDILNPDYPFKGHVKGVVERTTEHPKEELGQVTLSEKPTVKLELYNRQGYIVEARQYTENHPWKKDTVLQTYSYEQDSLLKMSVFTVADQQLATITYQHNEEGLLLEELIEQGNFGQTKVSYQYDELGQKIQRSVRENGQLQEHQKYMYSERGELIHEASLNHIENWADEIYYVRDRKGVLLQTNRDRAALSGPAVRENVAFEYNEHGDMRQQITTINGKQKIEVWEYRYDRKKNWTTRVHYLVEQEQKAPLEIVVRELEYF